MRYRTWRLVHWAAYLCWPVAVLHGLGTGSDTPVHWVLALTLACVALIVGLPRWRLAYGWPSTRPPGWPARSRWCLRWSWAVPGSRRAAAARLGAAVRHPHPGWATAAAGGRPAGQRAAVSSTGTAERRGGAGPPPRPSCRG